MDNEQEDAETLVVDTPEPEQEAPEVAEEEAPLYTFGDDAPEGDDERDPAFVKALRQKARDDAREKKRLADELAELKAKLNPQDAGAGEYPQLADYGYDEDQHAAAVKTWSAKVAADEAKQLAAQQEATKRQQQWAETVNGFEAKAKELAIPNFTETVETISDAFGDDTNGQQAKALFVMADDPRLLPALKASPSELARLVGLKNDPARLAIAIGELKGKIRAMPRKASPAVDEPLRGNAAPMEASDKALARLEAEAERTGDRSKVIAYKREQRQKAA